MTALSLDSRLATAGVGLGELTIEWGRRPESRPKCQLTKRDLRVLALVHDFGYLTTAIIAALVWGRYCSSVRERVKVLHDVGYLDKLRPRVSRTQGTSEWIYRLTDLGWSVLLDFGMTADGEDYAPARITSIAYVEHDVQVAALVTRLAAMAARAKGASGALCEAAPFALLGPRASAVEPSRWRAATGGVPIELGDRLVHPESATPGRIDPDATLVGVTPDGQRTAVMIEYDRTRRASKLRPKLRRYDYFLAAGWREGRYADLDMEPALLVVAATDLQVDSFTMRADDDLGAWVGARDVDRRNGEHVGREQTGFTSRSRLLAGDWRIEQVPALPPDLRRKGHSALDFAPRTTTLDISSLFARPA